MTEFVQVIRKGEGYQAEYEVTRAYRDEMIRDYQDCGYRLETRLRDGFQIPTLVGIVDTVQFFEI